LTFAANALHESIYIVHKPICIVHGATFTLHKTTYTVHGTICMLHGTIYTLHGTTYTAHAAIYIVHAATCALHETKRVKTVKVFTRSSSLEILRTIERNRGKHKCQPTLNASGCIKNLWSSA